MSDDLSWLPLLLGWPALLAALALSVLGLFCKLPRYLYASAILIMPISAYLAATPRFALVALLAPMALLVAGRTIKRNQTILAAALVVLVAVYSAWLAIVLN